MSAVPFLNLSKLLTKRGTVSARVVPYIIAAREALDSTPRGPLSIRFVDGSPLCHWAGRPGHFRANDRAATLSSVLNCMGVDNDRANDSPRGGFEHDYIIVPASARRRLRAALRRLGY